MNQEKDQVSASPETLRAEELVDLATAKAGDWISRASYRLMRGAARAREEAEDLWAEAQSMAETSRSPGDEG